MLTAVIDFLRKPRTDELTPPAAKQSREKINNLLGELPVSSVNRKMKRAAKQKYFDTGKRRMHDFHDSEELDHESDAHPELVPVPCWLLRVEDYVCFSRNGLQLGRLAPSGDGVSSDRITAVRLDDVTDASTLDRIYQALLSLGLH